MKWFYFLQCPDLTVTSEEKVLNAILMWGLEASELCGWTAVDELMTYSDPDILFGKRFQSVQDLLPLVRFPLLPYTLLEKVCTFAIKLIFWLVIKMKTLSHGFSYNNHAVGQQQH